MRKQYYFVQYENSYPVEKEFNESHAEEARNMGVQTDFFDGITLQAALSLVNKWNFMGANWKYWIN